MDGHPISFGPYRLVAAQRLLLAGDKPVRLGSSAFVPPSEHTYLKAPITADVSARVHVSGCMRYCYPHNSSVSSVVHEDSRLELPPWIGAEVTGRAEYYNSSLVARPYCRWTAPASAAP